MKLDFVITGTAHNETAKIYANSRHRVESIISVDILDIDGNKFNISNDELKEKLYFCDPITGERINSPWIIYNNPNEYTVVSNTQSIASSNSIRYIHKYISCLEFGTNEHTQQFSVGISVPGIGEFDTSQNGTKTKNCAQGDSGSVFKSPKSMELKGLRPIDYSVHGNLNIDCGEFVTISSSGEWTSKLLLAGPFWTHYNNKHKRRIVYIRPNRNTTGNDKFKKYQIRYNPVNNSELNTETETFSFRGMDVMGVNLSYSDRKPIAVIGWERGEIYELNMWFECKGTTGISGDLYTYDGSYTYRLLPNINENHGNDNDDGVVSFVLYKIVFDDNNIRNYKWRNVAHDVSVSVTDLYGNEGRFRLAFPDASGKFNEPGIV